LISTASRLNCVWITGANGLIGNQLMQTAPASASAIRPVGLSRDRLDLTDFRAVEREFTRQKPSAVIHCAALSRSPECEKNPPLARLLNVEVTRVLAGLAGDIPFLFFSSDLVFDGKAGNYDESASPNPLGVYGETKVAAEQIVLANPEHTVIRTSLNGGTSPAGDRGFNEQLRRAWERGQTLRLFTDEFRSPIAALVTARAVWELLLQHCTGVFHVTGTERLSRWQVGQLLAARWPDLHPKIEPCSAREYQGAPRPADTSLNCAKAQGLLSFRLPGLSEWLREHPNEVF
jgi:dTDP-4-dehydrorhamnose reductase